MVSGSASLMDIPNQMTAAEHGVTVVSVEYRKAPEFPWPAGPDDGAAVARALLDDVGAELGSERLLLGGESAGGYMAAAVALRIREMGAIDRVDGLNLNMGLHDWGGNPSQRGIRPTVGPDVLSPEFVELARECFVPGMTGDERRAPEVSPAYADLRGLPPCFVSVGTSDHLFDDSLTLATRAAAAGVDVDFFALPDLPHAFQVYDCGITRAWNVRLSEWMAGRIR
jgi:acetyl esterase/lipase